MTISKRHLLVALVVALAWQAQSHALVMTAGQVEAGDISQVMNAGRHDPLAFTSPAATSLTPPAPDHIPTDGIMLAQDDTVLFVPVDNPQPAALDRNDGPAFVHNVTAQQQFPLEVAVELGARSLVPLPGAVWLLLSALGLAGLLRGRNQPS